MSGAMNKDRFSDKSVNVKEKFSGMLMMTDDDDWTLVVRLKTPHFYVFMARGGRVVDNSKFSGMCSQALRPVVATDKLSGMCQ